MSDFTAPTRFTRHNVGQTTINPKDITLPNSVKVEGYPNGQITDISFGLPVQTKGFPSTGAGSSGYAEIALYNYDSDPDAEAIGLKNITADKMIYYVQDQNGQWNETDKLPTTKQLNNGKGWPLVENLTIPE